MAKIFVYGSVWSSDLGIVNRSDYQGSIDVAEVTPDMDLTDVITDKWWRGDVAYKFCALRMKELRSDGILFTYGKTEVFVPFGGSKFLEEVGLSYAYGRLSISLSA